MGHPEATIWLRTVVEGVNGICILVVMRRVVKLGREDVCNEDYSLNFLIPLV